MQKDNIVEISHDNKPLYEVFCFRSEEEMALFWNNQVVCEKDDIPDEAKGYADL